MRTLYFLTLRKSLFFFHSIARVVISTIINTKVFVTKLPNLSKSGSSAKFDPIFSFGVLYSKVAKKFGFEHSLALEQCSGLKLNIFYQMRPTCTCLQTHFHSLTDKFQFCWLQERWQRKNWKSRRDNWRAWSHHLPNLYLDIWWELIWNSSRLLTDNSVRFVYFSPEQDWATVHIKPSVEEGWLQVSLKSADFQWEMGKFCQRGNHFWGQS